VTRDTSTGVARLLPVVLFAGAAAYFACSWGVALDWTDQGQIVYPSWRVAQGAMPYRDFRHLYGPSLFYLNAALFHLWGSDLAVVRASLIVVRAAVATLVYLAARQVASWSAALIAYGLLVAVWGAPWWIFTTPYANHYAVALVMGGLLLFLARPAGCRGAFAAGLLIGTAATFKQTNAVFALIGFTWLSIHARGAADAAGPRGALPPLGRVARVLALVASLGVLALYLSAHPHLWTDVALLGPAAAVTALLGRRELVRPPTLADQRRALQCLASCLLGAAVPIGMVMIVYLHAGVLGLLVRDTLVGLPQQLTWFTPLPIPSRRTLWLAVAVAATLVAARRGRGGRFALGLAAVAWAAYGSSGVDLRRDWASELYRLVNLLPVVLPWMAMPAVFGDRASLPLSTFFFLAVASLPQLYPAGDFLHVIMGLPPFLVLLAWRLDGKAVAGPRGARRAGAVLGAALCAPFVLALLRVRFDRTAPDISLTRASGVFDPSPKFHQGAALVGYLDAPERRERPVLVITNEQLIYFLAGRVSVLDEHEFVLYLLEAGLLPVERARAAIDEGAVAARLEAMRPLIVDDPTSPATGRFRAAFPAVAALLDRGWAPVATFGGYRVLAPVGEG
jgi:hypothetical protein